MSLPAWLDDGPVDPRAPAVSLLDAGLRSGLGVFETLRAHGTATLVAERHIARLCAGAQRLGIAADGAHVAEALRCTLLLPRDVAEVAVRITLTAGAVGADAWPPEPAGRPLLAITLHPAPPLPRPATSAVTVPLRRSPADLKATSYLASVLAQRVAAEAGAGTAVLVDGDELLETADGSLVALLDGTLVLATSGDRSLAGITQALVGEEAARLGVPTRRDGVRTSDLAHVELLMVTSAVSGIRTLHTLDGLALPGSDASDAPHPLLAALREGLEARRA